MQPQKHPILIVLTLILVLMAGAAFILMQDSNPADERGTLTGNVVDASDSHMLKGVTVTAVDKDGVRYTLLFEANGYQTYESSASYKVKKDQTLEVQEAFRLAAADSDSAANPTPVPSPTPSPSPNPSPQPTPVPVSYTTYCIDQDGKQLSTMTNQGTAGSTVTVYAPAITGYVADTSEQTITLSEDAGTNAVYFYYNDPIAQTNSYNIPADAFVYNGHSYYACMMSYSTISSFWEAENYCEEQGGHLAVITSADLNSALYEYVFDDLGLESAYFGLTDDDSEDDWYWVTGAGYNYQNWLNGQPDNQNGNEDYALFYYKDKRYKWNDGDFGPDEHGTVTFLIEWDTQ